MRTRGIVIVVATVLCATLAGMALALSKPDTSDPPGRPLAAGETPVARSAPQGVSGGQRALGVMRRRRGAQDELPPAARRSIASNPAGAAVAEARLASRAERKLFVVPAAQDGVCLFDEGGTGACTGVSDVRSGSFVGYELCSGAASDRIVVNGMLGDEVRTVEIVSFDGSRRSVPVTDNVYTADFAYSEATPHRVEWIAAGAARSSVIGLTDEDKNQPCVR